MTYSLTGRQFWKLHFLVEISAGRKILKPKLKQKFVLKHKNDAEHWILIVQDWSCLGQTCCLKSQLVPKWFKKPLCCICFPCPCEYPVAPVIHGLQGVGAHAPFSLSDHWACQLFLPEIGWYWKVGILFPCSPKSKNPLQKLYCNWQFAVGAASVDRVWRILLQCMLEGTEWQCFPVCLWKVPILCSLLNLMQSKS